MTISPNQFEQFIGKLAQSEPGDNEDSMLQGQQNDVVPELLQPDEGQGEGPRAEYESFSTGAEKGSKQNQEGYLPEAFAHFSSAARQSKQELSSLLNSYGPDAIVSRPILSGGTSKVSSINMDAFINELNKIAKKGEIPFKP
ncbi:MAG: hypothetical protein ACFFFC_00995 [Candidatus Thorarchaeota archaeon]